MGYSPWGRKESDTTEQLDFTFLPCVLLLICLWPLPELIGRSPAAGLGVVRLESPSSLTASWAWKES